MKSLSVIIPVRSGDDPYITLHSLGRSTFQDFTITICQDEWQNANKARNAGFALAPDSEFVLFSDADIAWEPDGIERMIESLIGYTDHSNHLASFAFGSYEIGGRIQCCGEYDYNTLKSRNIASTMSVIRRDDFPGGFDETIERLQDYDLWLTMHTQLKVGVHCGSLIFRTEPRDGITQNGKVSYQEAFDVLRNKHRL